MGGSSQGQQVRKQEARPGASPNRSSGHGKVGLDHRGSFASSLRVSAEARRLKKAPSSSTHRHITAGHTPPPGADSDPTLPRRRKIEGVEVRN